MPRRAHSTLNAVQCFLECVFTFYSIILLLLPYYCRAANREQITSHTHTYKTSKKWIDASLISDSFIHITSCCCSVALSVSLSIMHRVHSKNIKNMPLTFTWLFTANETIDRFACYSRSSSAFIRREIERNREPELCVELLHSDNWIWKRYSTQHNVIYNESI